MVTATAPLQMLEDGHERRLSGVLAEMRGHARVHRLGGSQLRLRRQQRRVLLNFNCNVIAGVGASTLPTENRGQQQ